MIEYYELDGSEVLCKRKVNRLGEIFYQMGMAIKTIDNKKDYNKKKVALIESGCE